MNKTAIARSPEEMERIGAELAAHLRHGMVISLLGPLGAGKTTLTKGIAKGLLITDPVVSPTYLLARQYEGRIEGQGAMPLHHLDAYRVSSLDELHEVGLTELLPPADGVTVIEWPERVEGILEISDLVVRIDLRDLEERVVTISRP
jgi:tRNA threonylcarbamoyladenosine biosynthesis protein TsaE